MAETNRCPKCGAQLAADAPAGLCPVCLLQQALASDSQSGTTTGFEAGFVPPQPTELAGHFPQLEILEFIGKGGMGAVYKARQRQLDRTVALKILPPEVGRDPAFAERFGREARALAQLNHQNIVDVYDFGVADGLYYLTMEYVDGTNLRALIRAGGLAPKQALAIVPQVCEALQFAHDEGVVHRDIKPENILVNRRGQVKIADFGLAKLLGKSPAGASLTGTQQVMGTPHYMAPEQMHGSRDVDHRADIYSLGVVFYEMLTGQLPIGRFEPPSRRVEVDVRLDEVVLRTLESDPQRRYQHASEVKTAVQCICADSPAVPFTKEAKESAQQRRMEMREARAIAVLLAGLMVLALGLTACVMWFMPSSWCLLGLFIPLCLAPGIGYLARRAEAPALLAATVGFSLIGGLALIAYGIWLTESLGPLWAIFLPFLASYAAMWEWSDEDAKQSAHQLTEGPETQSETNEKPSASRPRLVPILATLNVAVAIVLMFVCAAPIPAPVSEPDSSWHVYEQVTTVLGFVMAAGLFIASVGLFLWRPWARKLTIGVMIYGLASLIVDIPYIVRYLIPTELASAQIEFADEGLPPDTVEDFALVSLGIGAVLLVIGLIWSIGQIVYFTRPYVVAAFVRSRPR